MRAKALGELGVVENSEKIKNDFHFINVIRFISVIGIVSIHCLILPNTVELNDFINHAEYPTIYAGFLNFLRFSVTCFCIISGYLVGSKIEKERFKFYCQRVVLLVKPFLIAFLLTVCFYCLRTISSGISFDLRTTIVNLLLHSPFWFIPSQLISLLVLVLFGKTKKGYVGIALFLILVFLTIRNVYVHPTSHINIIFSFAFVFYYWVGTIIHKYNWVRKFKKINLTLLVFIWLASFILLNFETSILLKNNFTDILNNLRISNQLYSIVSFILLVRISDYSKNFSFFNPRTESLGIYLYHWIFTVANNIAIRRTFNLNDLNLWQSIELSILSFVLTYSMTTFFVKLIKGHSFFFLNKNKVLVWVKIPSLIGRNDLGRFIKRSSVL